MNRHPECTPDGHVSHPERARRLREVAEDYPSALGTFKRAYEGTSLRASINAFCLECLGGDRAAIRTCTAPACPLYEVRPFQRKRGPRHA